MARRLVVAAMALWAVLAGAEGPSPAAPRLADLAWMAGSWIGQSQGLEMEEHWTRPKGGTMLGMHRDVAGGRTVSWEQLRIEETPDGIVYLASPRGRAPATPFRLSKLERRRAVFENPQHDFPQRIIYWMGDDGALHARVEGPPAAKEQALEWRWEKGAL